jgi:tetratricopeptide (TPR) repeat protein
MPEGDVSARSVLEERLAGALADMSDLDTQVKRGEIPPDRAAELRQRYEVEAADTLVALEAVDAATPARSSRRVLVGVGVATAAVAAAFIALVQAVEPRPPGGFITGGVAADVVRDGGVDLSRITNEELESVVAANPEVIGMRLALARRYVEAGDFSAALPHYFEVLDREPQQPEALMYLGWMTYVSGDAITGASLLERSLVVAPDNLLAMWFLANARLYGLDDAEGAIPLLEAVIAAPDTPPEVVAEAESMLAEAREDR